MERTEAYDQVKAAFESWYQPEPKTSFERGYNLAIQQILALLPTLKPIAQQPAQRAEAVEAFKRCSLANYDLGYTNAKVGCSRKETVDARDATEAIVLAALSALPPHAVDYEAGARAFTTALSSLGFPVPHRSDVLQAATACIDAALQPAAKEE